MKKFLLVFMSMLGSLSLNAAVGGGLASLVGVPFFAGALAVNAVPFLGNVIPSGVLPAGVCTDIWTGFCTKAFRTAQESIGWYNKIKSYDQYVNNDVIHFVNLGGDPTVLVNNTTYPLDIEKLEDADKPIGLDKYQTKPTQISDDELYAASYDKMKTVIERHRDAVLEKKYARAIHAVAPSRHTDTTPVYATTGTVSDGRKAITRKDIIKLKKAYDKMKMPIDGRILVLCPDHVAELLENDQKFAEQYYNYTTGKITNMYGFEVYEYSECPYYNATTLEKKAFGAVVTDDDTQASVAFYAPRMMKANGSLKVYLSEAKNDPKTQSNLYNVRQYSICLPLKDEAMGAIVSAKA